VFVGFVCANPEFLTGVVVVVVDFVGVDLESDADLDGEL